MLNSNAMKILILVSALACISAVPLPSFLHPCKIKSPDFHECSLQVSRDVLPHIVKGVKSLKIPPLDPLTLPEVNVASPNINIKFTNLILKGLAAAQVGDLRLSKKGGAMDLHINHVEITAHYVMDGRIVILPIQGDGPMNITAIGGNYSYSTDFEPFTKNGKNYLHVKNDEVKFKLEKAHFNFDNLFHGDERLGNEMNKFLNDHWEEVLKDLGGAVSQTIGAIVTSIITNIFEGLTQEQLFGE